MKPRRIDLHIHSSHSDGNLSPREIIEVAKRRNLSAISITDHDTVSALDEAIALGSASGIEVIPGIEMSVSHNRCELHFLGYFIDRKSTVIREYVALLKQGREERAKKIIEILNAQGIHLHFDLVKSHAKGSPIGRPHIADLLVEEGHVFSHYEAFQKYLGEEGPAYVPKSIVNPEQAIQIIKNAGGLAFWAHPATFDWDDNVIQKLVEYGLDGIETLHPTHTRDDIVKFKSFVKKNNLLESGGSDCHGKWADNPLIGTLDVPETMLTEMKLRADFVKN